ncbi:MAG TPA: universal stress protein [Solirubrobacteraceae bacterium]|jgi:nucleotide-binding universal stress UspA family protein
MILISCDGSADADAAIDRAAQLMPGAETLVLTVWEPFIDAMARNGGAMGMGYGMTSGYGLADCDSIDTTTRDRASTTALAGAERASAAGLVAGARVERRTGDIASTILAVAAEIDAGVIVMGTRGHGNVKAWLLGSISHAVVQHADRAVLIVPSTALGARRHTHVHGVAAHA